MSVNQMGERHFSHPLLELFILPGGAAAIAGLPYPAASRLPDGRKEVGGRAKLLTRPARTTKAGKGDVDRRDLSAVVVGGCTATVRYNRWISYLWRRARRWWHHRYRPSRSPAGGAVKLLRSEGTVRDLARRSDSALIARGRRKEEVATPNDSKWASCRPSVTSRRCGDVHEKGPRV